MDFEKVRQIFATFLNEVWKKDGHYPTESSEEVWSGPDEAEVGDALKSFTLGDGRKFKLPVFFTSGAARPNDPFNEAFRVELYGGVFYPQGSYWLLMGRTVYPTEKVDTWVFLHYYPRSGRGNVWTAKE